MLLQPGAAQVCSGGVKPEWAEGQPAQLLNAADLASLPMVCIMCVRLCVRLNVCVVKEGDSIENEVLGKPN